MRQSAFYSLFGYSSIRAYTEMNEDDILAAYKVKYEADILLTKCQLHTLLSNLQPELVLTLGSGRDLASVRQE